MADKIHSPQSGIRPQSPSNGSTVDNSALVLSQAGVLKSQLFKASTGISMPRLLLYLVYAVVFYGLIFTQIPILRMHSTNEAITQYILSKSTEQSIELDEVYNVTNIIQWIEFRLGSLVIEEQTMWNKRDEEDIRIANFNTLITPMRFLQTRRKSVDNQSQRFTDLVGETWSYNPLETFSGLKDDKNLSKDQYQMLGFFKYYEDVKPEEGVEGAFMIMYNIKTAEELQLVASEMIARFFLDSQTNSLIVDFVTYNGSTDVFSYVLTSFEVNPSGFVQPTFFIQTLDIEPYKETDDHVRFGFEVIFILLTLFYFMVLIYDIKGILWASQWDSQSKQKGKISRAIWAISVYFQDFWTIIDAVSNAFSIALIVNWLKIVYDDFRIDFVNGNIDGGNEVLNGFQTFSFTYSFYIRLVAINSLFIALRCCKYEIKFVRVFIIIRSLGSSKKQIQAFFTLCFGIICAFMLYSYYIFGSKLELFSDLSNSIQVALRMFFREMNEVPSMFFYNTLGASIYFYFFTIFLLFIVGNMIIAMNLSSYREQHKSFMDYKKSKPPSYQDHFFLRLKFYWIEALKYLRTCWDKDRRIIYKYREEEKILAQNQIDQLSVTEEVRKEFANTNYTTQEQKKSKNREFLTDKQIKDQIKVQAQQAGRTWVQALFFLLQYVIFIMMMLYQCEIPAKYDLNATIQDAIMRPVWQVDPDRSLETIRTGKDFEVWFRHAFPQIIEKENDGKYYIAGKNYLLGQDIGSSFRLSLKLVKLTKNDNSVFASYQKLVRERISMTEEDQDQQEYTEDIQTSSGPIVYEEDGGYNLDGAYVLYIPIEAVQLENWNDKFFEGNSAVDDALLQIVIDFCLYNGNYDMTSYVAIKFNFHVGGNIDVESIVYPVRVDIYGTTIDYFRAFLEILSIWGVLWQLWISIKKLKDNIEKFNVWSLQVRRFMTPKELELRNRIRPEWIRKFYAVIDLYVLLDFIFYIVYLVLIFTWAAIIVNLYVLLADSEGVMIGGSLSDEDTDYFEAYNELTNYLFIYYDIASIAIMLYTFRLLQYTALNRAMAFIQITMGHAYKDLLFFILLFATLLLGFSGLAYIGLGRWVTRFNSPMLAFMAVFEMMIGKYHWDESVEGDTVLGPIFIIFFMLMFMYIYANIFTAILTIAYSNFKEETHESDEKLSDPIQSIFVYCVQRWKKKQKYEEVYQETCFDEEGIYDTRFGLGQEDPNYFGNVVAEKLIDEKNARMSLEPKYRRMQIKYWSKHARPAVLRPQVLKFWDYMRLQHGSSNHHLIQIQKDLICLEKTQWQNYKLDKRVKKQMYKKYQKIANLEKEVTFMEAQMKIYKKEIGVIKDNMQDLFWKHRDTPVKIKNKP